MREKNIFGISENYKSNDKGFSFLPKLTVIQLFQNQVFCAKIPIQTVQLGVNFEFDENYLDLE